MNQRYIFRGYASAKIDGDFLKLDQNARFPIPAGIYIVGQTRREGKGTKHLIVYPKEEWDEELRTKGKRFLETSKNRSELEVIADDTRGVLRLPQSDLEYLNLRDGSDVHLQAGVLNYFEIWKKEVFEFFAQRYIVGRPLIDI